MSGEDRFVYIRSAFFVRIQRLWFNRNACIFSFLKILLYTGGALPPPLTLPHHFSQLNFISKILNFTRQIYAYQEGAKINTEVNERPLKNIGTHWNIRHGWFQRVPISLNLAGFYRMMLCIRGTCHGPVSVCLSVRPSVRLSVLPSQVGVLLKRLNIGSHKQHHTIALGL